MGDGQELPEEFLRKEQRMIPFDAREKSINRSRPLSHKIGRNIYIYNERLKTFIER